MATLPLMAVAMVRRSMLASNERVFSRQMGTVSRTPSATSWMFRPLPCLQSRPSPGHRTFATTHHHANQASVPSSSTSLPTEPPTVLATYDGPLARTFTRLKLFSLGSLGLASLLTPVLLLAPGEISLAGRIGLSITALATSGVSTALIAWIGTPYVGSMRLLPHNVMEINTVSWRLRPQQTLVYDPTLLRPTSRPFAAWELTNVAPPLALASAADHVVDKKVAETFDVKTGKSLGKWIVKYDTQTKTKVGGECKAVGKVVVQGKPTRYFNVHEELLGDDWQVLG